MKYFIENSFSKIVFAVIVIFVFNISCQKQTNNFYPKEIDSISLKWVPDKREGICTAEMHFSGQKMVLKGETDFLQAKEEIITFLKNKGVSFIDSLVVLPDTLLIKEPWALVTVSVCNMRTTPSHSAEMISQALMGTPVKVLKRKGGWYFIQTPDLYLGWVDGDAIKTKSIRDYNSWKSSQRIIYLKKTGDIFSDPGKTRIISDIVTGSILEIIGDVKDQVEVNLPDGRKGFINKSEGVSLSNFISDARPDPKKLLLTAESFTGIPYLWGGTSSKGFDCSGFVRTVYYLNGIILARDVSLQFRHGIHINKTAYPDSLKVGDLLFFGSTRNGNPRPSHIGMYIGDTEFIHASGMVRINSLDSARANFRGSLRNSFLGVRRIIGADPGKGIQLVSLPNWYK